MFSLWSMQTPLLLWRQVAQMSIEAQTVIALRTAGMMGLIRQDAAEPQRMVIEKANAASEAMQAAIRAAGQGQRADKVMAAALRPYRRRTKANVRRLSKKK
ncbi:MULTISPECIES: antibiotic ABC transporter [unclassified Paracoccus (in: a-proteobacteria)]|uniref:antibiotic ABC transporter n=1 Tax=unclassified Paracoccus (in: a-proteobacteria) TaxID=2688777 RepID=UPI0012B21C0E|nr:MULTISPECIES: antibiotic ABC transporter [unclassified Paracoccus (in: a-proteobacteria)]UXU74872.1 antibiotic ABC transporter [Paracoccus sp. SMMA_5]UXU80773.1 antibiotic ABC transporter [Paracoccus sp. SMMA_5_TC]